ncbi:hypothetical protein [Pedobacter metabolipauper]|uniref:Uncharacterized protein n=1 Tax=Pedobacter metabolipauper TaxID=425513 RepID=A0A4R6T275_9SPHI|nr:hypothetical protein [Pedobacter metabolipauper]TDQ11798.1 hypothetical protein ATK78_0927 [Pedobacter metabolipauper]
MQDKIFLSKEVADGEYQGLLEFLLEDLKLFKRNFFFSIKHVETGESHEYYTRYFEHQYQDQLLRLFDANDFEGMLAIPMGEYGKCATQLEARYLKSGKLVGLQVIEARPHEDGRYVSLTPAKVFVDEEGQKILNVTKQLRQD